MPTMNHIRRSSTLSVLNGMTGTDPEAAMDVHRACGLDNLDLKDAWFGKPVELWTTNEATRVAVAAAQRGLRIASLSSSLGRSEVDGGASAYRSDLAALDNLLMIVRILKPERIRLIAPSLAGRKSVPDATIEILAHHPWLFPCLRAVVDRLHASGAEVVFENESPGTVFGNPTEVLGFFAALDRPATRMIWDVGNWWHFGCSRFPTIADAQALLPVVGVLHLKGGIAEHPGGTLRWAGQLAETSWDVPGIVRTILAGGLCPVICLNPPHGATRHGVRYDYRADLAYLRSTFPEINS
jgi:sugar phosphate isomerase/epimerase